MKRTSLLYPRLVAFIPAFLLLVSLQSCVHYYYGPNSNNIPLLKKSGDMNISAGITEASESSGFEMQSAIAAGKHVGIMVNYYSAKGKDNSSTQIWDGFTYTQTTYNESGSGQYLEGAMGYFTRINETAIFEVYGGYGTGSITNTYSQFGSTKVSASKLFLQPSFGYSSEKGALEFAISSRFASVSLRPEEQRVVVDGHPAQEALSELRKKTSHFFWEPGFMVRGGFESMKIQLQYTHSSEGGTHNYQTQHGVFSLSLLFRFSTTKNFIDLLKHG